ncbi:MAG: hypothetical protein ACYYKD_01265 [Rhodospirillales bacterium]
MRTYTVYVRDPLKGGAREITAAADGFSPAWALFAFPLALAHGHWAAAALYALAFMFVSVIAGLFEPPVSGAVTACLLFLQGLTAADVRGWALKRAGYRVEGWGVWPSADAALGAVLAADSGLAEDLAAGLGVSGVGAQA